MQNRRVSYVRITGAVIILILIIFAGDYLVRSSAKKNNRNENLTVTTEDPPQETTSVTVPAVGSFEDGDGIVRPEIDEQKYKKLLKNAGELGVGELVLVNKDYSYKFQDISSVLVKMASKMDTKTYKLSYNTHEVQQAVMEPFNNMMADFFSAYNTRDLTIVTSHVPYADQNAQYVVPADPELLSGDLEMAPGYSEHHSGYALDFKLVSDTGKISSFDGTGSFAWISENSYKYGFVIRYPEGKEAVTGVKANPAHFRYVGVPHSYIMHENGFTLEEYLNDLKKNVFGYEHLNYSLYGYEYEIYYVPAEDNETEVPVPIDESYNVSGNNYDGYVVTICRKSSESGSDAEVTGTVTSSPVVSTPAVSTASAGM